MKATKILKFNLTTIILSLSLLTLAGISSAASLQDWGQKINNISRFF